MSKTKASKSIAVLILFTLIAACAPQLPTALPSMTPNPPTATFEVEATRTPRPTRTPTPTPLPTPARLAATVEVDVTAQGTPISPYLLGSNLPAWLKISTFEDEEFRKRVAASGVALLRIPGGSWGDEYGWLSCEKGTNVPGAIPCRNPWASRPTDFINFFRGVEQLGAHIEPMYIINVNCTAQEAAAAVAFYNSTITDTTPIGLDRNGADWKTAGDWAKLRAAGGNEQPLGIHWWEIGNEVHGGKPSTPGCPANGWEETWTCDGQEYVLGTDKHDGLVAMRAAMLAVDPSIVVGAVGGSDALLGNRWSEAVLKSGGTEIDYLVIHTYPRYHNYGNPAKELAEIVAMPQTYCKSLKQSADKALASYAPGIKMPLVVNEYEIVPEWGRQDVRNYMNKYVDAFWIADSIGQMIVQGFDIAAQWDIMNGKSDDFGNEFGLMKADGSNDRQPKYWVFPLWARFGAIRLPVTSSAKAESELSVYAGRTGQDEISLLVLNKTERPADVQIVLNGAAQVSGGLADVVAAPSLDSLTATFNGVADPADDLSDAPAQAIKAGQGNRLDYAFAPLSITLLRLQVKK